MHVVTVIFEVSVGHEADFRAAVMAQARASLANSPGCRRFDVAIAGTRVFLYELYDDPGCFEGHLQTPHFKAFSAATGDWVANKSVEQWTLAVPPG